jgi:hypothetical protein
VVTWRSVGIGLAMVILIIGLTEVIQIQHEAAEVAGNAPPPAPTILLFFYVLLLAPLLLRANRWLAVSRGELLLIYAMMLVAGSIPHEYSMGFLIPHTVSPLYFNVNEPGWKVFKDVLPTWFGPTDRAAINTFFRGGDGTVPWAAWLVPMVAWSSLLLALFSVMLCLTVLLRRPWVEQERLTFPLAALPLALTEGDGRGDAPLGRGLQLLKQPLFWQGIILVLLLRTPSSLHLYIPQVPDLPLRDLTLLDTSTGVPLPWKGLGRIEVDVSFWLIGIAYLLPKEITLSAVVFYFIRLLENVFAVFIGTSGEAPSVYSNDFPALFAQGAGAAFALTGITLWAARHHLAGAFRRAFRPASGPSDHDDRGEFLSYRTAYLGAILGTAFILVWLWLAGMRLWVAVLFLALMLSYFLIFARIRAETGLGMGVILWPKMLDEVMVTIVGAKFLLLPEITALYGLRWLYFGSATGSVMASELEGLKLAGSGGLRGGRVGGALALVLAVTVPLAFAWTLKTYYGHGGFEQMPIGNRDVSMVGSQIYWSYSDLVSVHNEATGPDWGGIAAIATGGVVATALSVLRARFVWFPLHPVGYLAANSWGIHINWFSFFLGWLINMLVTRYGGLKIYRRLLPFFFGLIVGDMLHEGIWGVMAWITGGRQ